MGNFNDRYVFKLEILRELNFPVIDIGQLNESETHLFICDFIRNMRLTPEGHLVIQTPNFRIKSVGSKLMLRIHEQEKINTDSFIHRHSYYERVEKRQKSRDKEFCNYINHLKSLRD